MTVAQTVLLAVAVVLQLASATAFHVARRAPDRLHLVGPVSVLATLPLVAAVALQWSSTSHVAKTVATAAVLWGGSPFVTRATARALRIRTEGRLHVADSEREGGAA